MLTEFGDVLIRIQDNGVGIPSDELEIVTEPFFRSTKQDVTTTTETGLGLSIAKSLVELHGGQFAINSTVGEGTTVEIVLPKDRVQTIAGVQIAS